MIETAEKFYVVTCANCGKDVEIGERPDEKCYWCHKSALKKEDITMVAQINAKDLKPATVQKLGIAEEIKTAGLPPVPSRPDTSGKGKFQRNHLLHDYYDANAEAIITCCNQIGDKAARQRWGFSECGWTNFRRRHSLPIGAHRIKGSRRVQKAAAPAKNPAPPSTPEKPKTPAAAAEEKPHLLKFPDFNEIWPNDVCIAWMNCYVELHRIDHPAFSVQVTANPAVASLDVQIQKLNWIRRISKRLWE